MPTEYAPVRIIIKEIDFTKHDNHHVQNRDSSGTLDYSSSVYSIRNGIVLFSGSTARQMGVAK